MITCHEFTSEFTIFELILLSYYCKPYLSVNDDGPDLLYAVRGKKLDVKLCGIVGFYEI